MRHFIIFVLGLCVLCSSPSFSQESAFFNKDLSTVRVEQLSESQIRQIANEINKSDMTEQELMNLARLKGMPEGEIVKLQSRLRSLNKPVSSEYSGKDDTDLIDVKITDERKIDFEAPKNLKNIFGASLFSTEKLTFEPSLNIPTPNDYQLGPGDEIVIDIWGSSKQNYRLTVTRTGNINIDNLGPIYVNGLTIETASEKIINRLSEIYYGLRGSNPSTYAQVSVGRVRSVKVTILGEARAPGTYTLPSLATVFNALYLSGGPSYNGSFRNIQVIRNNKVITTIDVYGFLLGNEQGSNIRIEDQDIIRINPYSKRIEVTGEVKRPMIYEIRDDENLNDLITYAAGFTDQAYTHLIKVKRKTSRERRIENVEEAEFVNFALLNGDEVVVEPILNRYENRVEIKGAVFRSGEYQLTNDLTVKSLIAKAEGLRKDAFLSRGMIFRTKDDYSTEVIAFNVREVLNNESADIVLQREDVVNIPSIYDLREEYFVRIEGAIQEPGQFPYMENMTLEDLVIMSGGFTEAASESKIEIARRLKNTNDASLNQIAEVFHFSVNKNLQIENPEDKFILEPFDEVHIRQFPGYEIQQSVRINGEVLYPGKYALQNKDEYLSDLIYRAGGLTDYAYARGAMLIRTINGDTTKVGISLEKILERPKSKYDLYILPGDKVFIPKELQTVMIKGEVLNPVSVKYQRNLNFRDYVASAGGFTSEAHARRAYIRYPDGSADKTRKVLFFNNYPSVTPGSEIFIPQEPERRQLTTQEVISISTGLATLALLVLSIIR